MLTADEIANGAPARRLAVLDALRGIASLLVLIYHLDDVLVARGAATPFGGLGHGGARGVDFLFVLSGYVMGRLYLRDGARRVAAGDFLKQRASRLLPLFWIVSILALALYLAGFGGPGKLVKLEPWHLAASFLLLPQDAQPLVNVSWFLVYEALFYALVALALVNRRAGLAAIVFWQGSIILLMLLGHPNLNHEIPSYVHPRALGIGIGLAFALLGQRLEREATPSFLRFALVTMGILLVADMGWEGVGERDTHGLPIILLDVAAGVLLISATALESRCSWRPPPLFARLGVMSYSVYLTHFAAMTLAVAVLAGLGVALGNLAGLACATAALILGATMHHWVDRPIQSALRRIRRRDPLATAGARHCTAEPVAPIPSQAPG